MPDVDQPQSTTEAPPGPGHNLPPTRGEIVADEIKNRTTPLRQRIAELEVGLLRVPQEIDSTNAETATDFVKQVKRALGDAEKLRKDMKQPSLDEGRAIEAAFKALVKDCAGWVKGVQDRIDTYRQKKAAEETAAKEAALERARKTEAEALAEAEQKRQEGEEMAIAAQTQADRTAAAAKLAEAKDADSTAETAQAQAVQTTRALKQPTQIRGDYGAVATGQKHWTFEIENYDHVNFWTLRPYIGREAIEKAIRAFIADGGRDLAGVRIFESETTVVR